jgi:dephospho-CoA kinase
VDCSEEQQIARVMGRSKLSQDEVLAIMATQSSRKDRLAIADDVINNEGSSDTLYSQVKSLHRHYLKLAA